MLHHFFNDIPDPLVIGIYDNIFGAGRQVKPVVIRFPFIAPFVVPLLQRFFRTGECETDHLVVFGGNPVQDSLADPGIRQHNRGEKHIFKIRIQVV